MIRLYGSAYLNLQHQAEYIDILCSCIKRYGVNNPVSRLSKFTNSDCYMLVENEIAQFFSSQSACLLPNGYLSGLVLRNVLLEIARKENYSLIYDANGHPCYQSRRYFCDKIDFNFDFTDNMILIINSINSFFGCLDETWFLSRIEGVKVLAIDVSHTAHIIDHSILLEHVKDDVEVIYFGSLGKAAAFAAGFIAGNKNIIELIKAEPEYSASTPPSIAGVHAYMLSRGIRDSSRNHLMELIDDFKTGLGKCKADNNYSFPVFNLNGNRHINYEKLLSLGYEASYMSYPFHHSEKQLRLILNAGLTKEQVKTLITVMIEKNVDLQSYEFKSNIEVVVEKPSNKALHRTAIPLRSIAAGELGR